MPLKGVYWITVDTFLLEPSIVAAIKKLDNIKTKGVKNFVGCL